jgi:hypothetical protein
VIAGGASPAFFREAANRIEEILPNGRQVVLEGQDHAAPAVVIAPVVAEFLALGSWERGEAAGVQLSSKGNG